MLMLVLTDGFDVDVSARCRASMEGVEIPPDVDPASPQTLEYFEAKLQELQKSGKSTPRAEELETIRNSLQEILLGTTRIPLGGGDTYLKGHWYEG